MKPKIDRILLYPKYIDGPRVVFIRGRAHRSYGINRKQYNRLVKIIRTLGGRFNRGFPKAWILARAQSMAIEHLKAELAEAHRLNKLYSDCLLRANRLTASRDESGNLHFLDGAESLARLVDEVERLRAPKEN